MSTRAVILPYDDGSNKYRKELIGGLGTIEEIEPIPGQWNSISPLLVSAFFIGRRPDVIHIHWLHLFFFGNNLFETTLKLIRFPIELLLLYVSGIRVVWTVHNLQEHDRRFPHVELIYRIVAAYLVSDLIVHCEQAKDLVVAQYRLPKSRRKDIHVIPHGHYIDTYKNSTTPEKARNELNIDEDTDVFLYFGQIRPYKQVPYLIDEFRRADLADATLLIAGNPNSDSCRDEIRQKTRNDPQINATLDFIPENKIQMYMNVADVVVLPYRDILTSGTAILAMSFQRPVIAPAIRCLPELLEQQEELLFDPSKNDGLSNALQRSVEVDTIKLGEQNYEYVKKFDWGKIAAETGKIYMDKL